MACVPQVLGPPNDLPAQLVLCLWSSMHPSLCLCWPRRKHMGLECRRMAVRDVSLPYGLSSSDVPRLLVTSSAVPLQFPSPGSGSSSRKLHPAHLHLRRNTPCSWSVPHPWQQLLTWVVTDLCHCHSVHGAGLGGIPLCTGPCQ